MRHLIGLGLLASAIGLGLLVLLWALSPPAGAHDWYTNTYMVGSTTATCCGGNDCTMLPEAFVRVVPGGYQVDVPKGWMPTWPEIHAVVPNAQAQPAPTSADYHMCVYAGRVRCFFFPAPSY